MASRLNVLAIVRSIKNVLTTTTQERVLSEFIYDTQGGSQFKYRTAALVEQVSLANLASGTMQLTTLLPANARVLAAGMYAVSAITLQSATNVIAVGLGSGTSTAFYTSPVGTTIALGVSEFKPVADTIARAGGTSATPITIDILKSDGTASGTNFLAATGTLRVGVLYTYAQPWTA